MGYPTTAHFDKAIIERTKQNLECMTIANDFTQLLNSLFGLIIIPTQMKKQSKRNLLLFEKKLSDFTELDYLRKKDIINFEQEDQTFKEITIDKLYHGFIKYDDIKIEDLLERFRDSLAHCGIRPTKENEEWQGIIFRCYDKDNQNAKWEDNHVFQIYLNQIELKTLCMFLIREYLKELGR